VYVGAHTSRKRRVFNRRETRGLVLESLLSIGKREQRFGNRKKDRSREGKRT